ncbi:hypothetical protein GYMLUDRAFT_181400, partial [Collybiopsis luxurians FD-317 M1]
KQNQSHYKAYCLGCLNAGSVLGKKDSMIAHILGGKKPCQHAGERAKKSAEELQGKSRNGSKKRGRADNSEDDVEEYVEAESSKKRQFLKRAEKKQSTLEGHIFKGIAIPFSNKEMDLIATQFLHATLSANLPFHWVKNLEVIKLFLMFCSRAGDVVPSAKKLSTTILTKEDDHVCKEVKRWVSKKDVVLMYVPSFFQYIL